MNIEELAKEAGIDLEFARGVNASDLRTFARLVAERCAGIVYEVRMRLGDEVSDLRENIRDTIRQEFGI